MLDYFVDFCVLFGVYEHLRMTLNRVLPPLVRFWLRKKPDPVPPDVTIYQCHFSKPIHWNSQEYADLPSWVIQDNVIISSGVYTPPSAPTAR